MEESMKNVLVILLLFAIIGCTTDSGVNFIGNESVSFQTIIRDGSTFQNTLPATVVLRNKAQEDIFLAEHPATKSFPDVDYSRHMVIGMLGDMREGAMTRISIDSIQQLRGTLNVYSHELYPASEYIGKGNPAHLVVVGKNLLPVHFEPATVVKEPPPQIDELVWVSISYVGGVQCDPSSHYTPPDVRQVLNDADVSVFDTAIEGSPVCLACTCPSYAAMHFAQIKKDDVEKAEQAGFQQTDPPAISGS